MIIVDTNVTSELMRSSPSSAVAAWVRAAPTSDLFTTSITLAEVDYGIERLPDGRRKQLLRAVADEVFAAFAERVLAFDSAAAGHYGRIVNRRERLGAPINGFDAQIASICRSKGAALATRNVKDFQDIEIDLIDPWCHVV